MIRKTSAMVEAGILAAVAIVMALISMYVPVLGAFVNFDCYRDYRDDYQPN